jgi:rhodanese-related sulfurtransferase
VNADELEALLSSPNPPQLLDVRTNAEWELGHIDGAINVPLGQLEEQQDYLPIDHGDPVVAICLTAHRSIPTVRLLRRHGYEVVQLQGGMRAWRAAGKREVRRSR